MDHNSISMIVVMAALVLMSAYFSATETAFSSLNSARLKAMAERGNRKAALALRLADQYDRLLSTILIGNNIVNIAVASMGTVLFVRYFGDLGATISTVVVTVVVLIFGEISPKSLAKDSPERFAMFSAPILQGLVWLLTPVNYLFTQWKRLLSRLIRVREERKLTQEELLVMVEEVEQSGGIDQEEGKLLRSAIEFPELRAKDVLTHRADLEAVPLEASGREVAAVFQKSGFSRLPVYEGSIDRIVGIVHQKDFYSETGLTGKPLGSLMTPPLFVTKSITISELLRLLQKRKTHMAVVCDEYGGTLGIVTMEDILEELVGEIWDEHDEIVEEFRQTAEGTVRAAGSASLDKLFARFRLADEDTHCETVGGWVTERLGRIPAVGDCLQYGNLELTVTGADDRRILELEVRQRPRAACSGGQDETKGDL